MTANITAPANCPSWAVPDWAFPVFISIILFMFTLAIGSSIGLWILLHWKDSPDPFKTMLLLRACRDGTWYITHVKSQEKYRELLKEMRVKWFEIRGTEELGLDSFFKGEEEEEVKELEV